MKTLVMVFKLDNGKNFTMRLPNAKNNLARANVEPVMQSIIDRQFFSVGVSGAEVVDIAEAYLQEVTETQLI